MAKVPVADDDILTLNVGGTILVTKRATLTQVAHTFVTWTCAGQHAEMPACPECWLVFLTLVYDINCKHLHTGIELKTLYFTPACASAGTLSSEYI